VTRGFQWAVLILSSLVALGVFLQVYFIASYMFGAGTDALDLHKDIGGIVHGVELLVFIAALVGFWKKWADVGWAFALALIGTVQLGFSDGDDWVGGLHGLLALFVLVIAGIVSHRTMRALGVGPYRASGAV
jgi:hypothetical protein